MTKKKYTGFGLDPAEMKKIRKRVIKTEIWDEAYYKREVDSVIQYDIHDGGDLDGFTVLVTMEFEGDVDDEGRSIGVEYCTFEIRMDAKVASFCADHPELLTMFEDEKWTPSRLEYFEAALEEFFNPYIKDWDIKNYTQRELERQAYEDQKTVSRLLGRSSTG